VISVHGFPDSSDQARAIAGYLGMRHTDIDVHVFPDGESLVTAPKTSEIAVLVRSLHHPNDKLIEVMLAASALRDCGARRVILVAAYLPYMRQDAAFKPGQAISQRIIGAYLARCIDGLVTVAPHLHRINDLGLVVPDAAIDVVPAVDIFARLLGDIGDRPILIGPDEESAPLISALSDKFGLDFIVGTKTRYGDRQVDITLPRTVDPAGRRVILVDDVISSGTTLAMAARQLRIRGAAAVEAIAIHALYDDHADLMMIESGITKIRSADGVPHKSNSTSLAVDLAGGTARIIG